MNPGTQITNATATGQVTLENWRRAPWNRWAFRNVRRVLPTAEIRPGRGGSELGFALKDLSSLPIATDDGREETVGRLLAHTQTDGLVVMRGGRIVYEWYDAGFTQDDVHLLFSVSKSILGLAVGIQIDRGGLDPDRKVIDYVPELEVSGAYRDTTVRNLLDMEVGIAFDETYDDPRGNIKEFRIAAGWDPEDFGYRATGIRPYLTTLDANGEAHGTRFHYVSTNTDVLAWVLDRVSGLHYADYLSQNLWQPMGARHGANLALDPTGIGRASGGISASVRDIALIGECMRNRGVVNGRPVVPGWWIDDIRSNGSQQAWQGGKMVSLFPEGNYRNQWYNPTPTSFCAGGIHGQWIYIDREAEMVIARVASQPKPADYGIDGLCFKMYQAIGKTLMKGESK